LRMSISITPLGYLGQPQFLLPQLHAPVLRLTVLAPDQPAVEKDGVAVPPPALQRASQPLRFDVAPIVERQGAGAPIYRPIVAYSVADEDAAEGMFGPADYAQLFTFEAQWRDTGRNNGDAGFKSSWQALQPLVLDDGRSYLALSDPSWPFKIRLALVAEPDAAPTIYVAVNEDFDRINQLAAGQLLTNLRINLRAADQHFLRSESDKYSLHLTVEGQDDPVRLAHHFEDAPAGSLTSQLQAPSPAAGSGRYHRIYKIELTENDVPHASDSTFISGHFWGHDPEGAASDAAPILLSYDVATHNFTGTHLEQIVTPEGLAGKYGSFIITTPAGQLSENGALLWRWHYRPHLRFDFLKEGQSVTDELLVTVFERGATGRMVDRRDDSIVKLVVTGDNDPLRAYFGDDPTAQTTHIFVTPSMHAHYWHFGLTIDDPDHNWDVMRAAMAGGRFDAQALAEAMLAHYQIFVRATGDDRAEFTEWRSFQGGGEMAIGNVLLGLRPFGYGLPDGGVRAGSFMQVVKIAGDAPAGESHRYEMKIVNRLNPSDLSHVHLPCILPRMTIRTA